MKAWMEEEHTEGFSTPDSEEEELDSDYEGVEISSRMMTGKTDAMRKAMDTAQG
mgnify:FL=1